MKFLTLNCHSWQEDNQNEKITYLAETLNEKSYDVIALQEVSQVTKDNDLSEDIKVKENNFAVVLLEELKKIGGDNYSLIWGFSHLYKDFEEGLAIITKHAVVERHAFYASITEDFTNWKARRIVGATLEIGNKEVDFYSCHLGWWHDEEEPFKDQARNLLKKINMDKVTFLMGDFNNDAFISGEGYDYFISQGLHDTYNLAVSKDDGVTVKGEIAGWEGHIHEKRIDLILTNHPIPVTYSNVIFNGNNKAIVSDHFGVEIEVSI